MFSRSEIWKKLIEQRLEDSILERLILTLRNGEKQWKTSEGEEILKRIQNYKGVTGLIIVNKEGVPVRSTMDNSTSVQYAAHFRSISDQAQHCVRDIDPVNELTFFRIRSKKYEVMVAPDNDYLLVVMQSPIN